MDRILSSNLVIWYSILIYKWLTLSENEEVNSVQEMETGSNSLYDYCELNLCG